MAKPKKASALAADTGTRKSVLVTFKPKDSRRNKIDDKLEILAGSCPRSESINFFDMASAESFAVGSPGLPTGMPSDAVGYDINLYDAPIVSLKLSDNEIKALKGNPDVVAVEDDGLAYALPAENLFYEGQPSVHAETVPVGVQQIKAVPAWGCSRGRGIKVAVLDTGIDWLHTDLAANVKGAVSFVPGETAMDGNSHGTHCAGTIGAAINGSGVVGVAPEAWLYGVKVLSNSGAGQYSWVIAGINWAIQNKMQIVSMSLGGSSAPAALEAICTAAFNAGVLLVAAAGNAGPGINTVGFPARYKSVVAVSAIDASNVIAPFSSRGPEVEICAPGVQTLSTVPGGGYGTKSGTSMACPHVAGAAAVIWGAHRFANNRQIWDLLAATADNFGPHGWDTLYGYGRVDAEQAAMAMVPAPVMAMKP